MKTKIYLTFVLLTLFYTNSFSQMLQWAKAFSGTGTEAGTSVATDASGNIYTIGNFDGVTDFDPGLGTFNLTSPGGLNNIFITKLSPAGNFIWAKVLGGSFDDYANSIAIDDDGYIYTTGRFQGTADFNPGGATFNLTAVNGFDIFISKLDTAGNFVWAKSMGGNGSDVGYSITTDTAGNVYSTGTFEFTVDFNPNGGTFDLSSSGLFDFYISKLDSAGNFVWAKSIGGTDYDISRSIALDSAGNVYTAGTFGGTVDFDPDAGTSPITSAGGYDIFISKLSSAGNFVWGKAMGGTGYDYETSIATDTAGNLFISGYFNETIDFDPSGASFTIAPTGAPGYSDIFITKLNAAGNFAWAKAIGGTGNDYGYYLTTDIAGNVYTTGTFYGVVDFDPGAGIFNLIPSVADDIFVSKLDGAGNYVWAAAVAGPSNEMGQSIAVDNVSGGVYTTGFFQATVDFDPGAGTFNMTSAGSRDVFLLKLVDFSVSINENQNQSALNIYPNPSTGLFTLENTTAAKVQVSIFNVLGKKIQEVESSENKVQIDLSKQAKGVYFVQLKNGTSIQSQKIIVQ